MVLFCCLYIYIYFFLSFGCPTRNHKKAYVNEEKQVIMRNLLLPIPSEPSLKADVSGVSFAKFQYFEGNWLYCSNRFKCQKLTLHFFHYCLTAEQVGRLQCSLLLVVGEDDQNWPSYESALDVSWRTFLLIVLYGMVFIFSVRIKAYVIPWPLLRNVIWLYQQLVRYKLWLFYSYTVVSVWQFIFDFFFFSDERDDGKSRECSPAYCPVLSQHWSSDWASILATYQIQQLCVCGPTGKK